MNTRQKLEIIQKMLGLTQTKLALKFGVSFAAFNSWWTGKSSPEDIDAMEGGILKYGL